MANFRLDLNIGAIYNGYVDRKAQLRNKAMPTVSPEPTVRFICVADQIDASELEKRIASIASQTYKNFTVSVVIRKSITDAHRAVIEDKLRRHGLRGDYVVLDGTTDSNQSLGSIVMHCINAGIKEDYILILATHERMFSNHLEVLMGSAIREPNKSVYATASILCHRAGGEEFFDYCEKIELTEASRHMIASSRFLISTRRIRPDVDLALPYLDELAIGALIQDPISVEVLATALRDISAAPPPVYSFSQQYSVLAEYSPWLFMKDQVTGYSIPAVPPRVDELRPRSMSFNGLSNDNRIELFASLLEATLPAFIITPLFWIYDKLTGRG